MSAEVSWAESCGVFSAHPTPRKVRAGCWACGDLCALFTETYLKIQMDEGSHGQKRDSRGDSQELAWGGGGCRVVHTL